MQHLIQILLLLLTINIVSNTCESLYDTKIPAMRFFKIYRFILIDEWERKLMNMNKIIFCMEMNLTAMTRKCYIRSLTIWLMLHMVFQLEIYSYIIFECRNVSDVYHIYKFMSFIISLTFKKSNITMWNVFLKTIRTAQNFYSLISDIIIKHFYSL